MNFMIKVSISLHKKYHGVTFTQRFAWELHSVIPTLQRIGLGL